MSTRDIQDQLKELYDVDVSSQLISTVSNEVMEEVLSWQNRPLDSSYPKLLIPKSMGTKRRPGKTRPVL